MIKEAECEALKAGVLIGGFDGFNEFPGEGGGGGAELEEAIVAGGELVGDLVFEFGGVFEEVLELF